MTGDDLATSTQAAGAANRASRPLDFVVCGVPRSGTSATVQYLNACTGLRCFSELFHEAADHGAIRVPDRLTAMAEAPGTPANKAEQARHWLDRYDREIADSLVGNKTPAYYLHLGRVLDALSTGRALLCLRDVTGVMGSYDARARGANEWHAGRTGLYAAAEQIVVLKRLAALAGRDVLIVPHAAWLGDALATVRSVVAFLSAGTGRDVQIDARQVAGVSAQGAHRRATHTALDAAERQMADLMATPALTALVSRTAPIHLRDLPDEALREIAALPSDLLGFAEPLVRASEHPPTRNYWPAFCEDMEAGEQNPRAL